MRSFCKGIDTARREDTVALVGRMAECCCSHRMESAYKKRNVKKRNAIN